MSKQMIGSFAIISIAYIASYTLVVGFLSPLQHLIFPTFTTSISLLFLPHGIRILAAYYYGWKSFFLLLPSMYFMWVITVYGSGVPLHPTTAPNKWCELCFGYYDRVKKTYPQFQSRFKIYITWRNLWVYSKWVI